MQEAGFEKQGCPSYFSIDFTLLMCDQDSIRSTALAREPNILYGMVVTMPNNTLFKKVIPVCMLVGALGACGGENFSPLAGAGTGGVGSTGTIEGVPPTKQPPTNENQPVNDGNKPATDENKPATDGTKPATDGNKPATDGNKPVTGDNTSVTGGNTPVTGDNSQVNGGNTPGGKPPTDNNTTPVTEIPPPPPPISGKFAVKVVNNTHGKFADAQVYWTYVGRDPSQKGAVVYLDKDGKAIPMALSDNGALTKNGEKYANWSHTLAETASIKLPPLDGSRLYISLGSPIYMQVNTTKEGDIGYTTPSSNPADPNADVYWDFMEAAIGVNGNFFGNTTRVDGFNFPIQLRLQAGNGYDQTVGELDNETRDSIFKSYLATVPEQFRGLASGLRIIAPGHASFRAGGVNATYMDSYVDTIWKKYTTEKLTFTMQLGTFTGQVKDNVFEFTDADGKYIVNKPTTSDVMLCENAMADPKGAPATGNGVAKQLQIQTQLCAAINRHIVEEPANWGKPESYYKAAPANYYAAFWHDHSYKKLAYGFSYDDAQEQSPVVQSNTPTAATVIVGW